MRLFSLPVIVESRYVWDYQVPPQAGVCIVCITCCSLHQLVVPSLYSSGASRVCVSSQLRSCPSVSCSSMSWFNSHRSAAQFVISDLVSTLSHPPPHPPTCTGGVVRTCRLPLDWVQRSNVAVGYKTSSPAAPSGLRSTPHIPCSPCVLDTPPLPSPP